MSTILLVEDEDMLRNLLKDLLLHRGFQVADAPSGNDALEICDGGLVPDLVVSDVAMPGMNGEVLVEILRKRYVGIKVIFMSGYAGSSTTAIQNTLLEEGVAYLQKPFRMATLVEKIKELLA